MATPKLYSRTRLFDTWETDYFADYTPKEFAIWLAGFFDGEGCVHLPPKSGIEVTIASTDINVIFSIHKHVGVGTLEEVTFDNEKWRTKYCWRIRRADDAAKFFRMIRLYSTIKAEAIDRGMERVLVTLNRRHDIDARNEEIIERAAAGETHGQIAERFGVCRQLVGTVLFEARHGLGRVGRVRKAMNTWTEKGKKKPAQVKTSTTKLMASR